jgi:hypothetical protein
LAVLMAVLEFVRAVLAVVVAVLAMLLDSCPR